MRQLDVARSLKFGSADRICRWEKGRTVPHLVNLFKLAALYGVTPDELYGEYFKTIRDRVLNPSQEVSPLEDISSSPE